jgi:hypothetical protein
MCFGGTGSRGPGTGLGSDGHTPDPLLQAQTDQAHGAVCAWQSGWADSRDAIPGCASCKDEGPSVRPSVTITLPFPYMSCTSLCCCLALLLQVPSSRI